MHTALCKDGICNQIHTMTNELQNVLSQKGLHLHERKKLNLRNQLKLFLSFCFQKSKHLLFGLDALSLSLFLWLPQTYFNEQHFISLAFLNVLWMFVAHLRGLYKSILFLDAEVVIGEAFKQWAIFVFVALLLFFPLFSPSFTGAQFLVALLLFGAAILANRILFLSVRKKYKYAIVKRRKIVVIGRNTYSSLFESYVREGCSDYLIHDWYEKENLRLSSDVHGFSDLNNMRKQGVNEIYCCLSAFSKEELQRLLAEADRLMIRVKFLPEFLNVFDRNVQIENIGNIPVISVRAEPLLQDRNKLIKRIFDIGFSLLVILFLLSWLMPIIWLAIRIESKGPLFFKQKRSGIDNKPFFCYKFRSMVANNKTADQAQATKNDKRITKVGAFLRKTSLDELPQFFNVLMGNMSIVGPRPHMLSHTDQYSRELDTYMIRHYVKPGITGWAQVNGFRGETREIADMQHRVQCDIIYVEGWTFLLDLKIIFLTIWNIVRGEENAY